MADADKTEPSKLTFKFIRGVEGEKADYDWPDGADIVRKALAESLNAKNVAFLLGAGCSSSWANDKEVGIPTMAPLAKEFTAAPKEGDQSFPTADERDALLKQFGIDLGAAEYARNLERLMELLFSLRFVLGSVPN